jgi:hypothetical protein
VEPVLSLAYATLFYYIIQKTSFFRIDGISHKLLSLAFAIKLVCAVLLSLVFSHFYTNRLTADTFKFFDDSKIMFSVLHEHPTWFFRMLTGIDDKAPYLLPYYDEMHNWYNKAVIFNDYRFQIRFNAFLHFFSLGYYYVHAVIYCFLSFIGLTALLKLFIIYLPHYKRVLYACTYFMPSVLFWGSGLLKDSLIFFATGMSLYCLHQFVSEKKIRSLLLFIIFLLFLMLIKFHNFILLVPLYAAFALSSIIKRYYIAIFGIITVVYYFVLLQMNVVLPGYGLMELLSRKQAEFIDLANSYQAQSVIPIHELKDSEWSAIRNTPQALSHVFFRPYFWESKKPLIVLAGIENLLIVFLALFTIFSFRLKNLQITPLLLLSFIYTLSLFEMIGLVTPVMGAIVRYKIQALPFLLFFFACLSDKSLLTERFRFLKKIV